MSSYFEDNDEEEVPFVSIQPKAKKIPGLSKTESRKEELLSEGDLDALDKLTLETKERKHQS